MFVRPLGFFTSPIAENHRLLRVLPPWWGSVQENLPNLGLLENLPARTLHVTIKAFLTMIRKLYRGTKISFDRRVSDSFIKNSISVGI